MLKSKLLLPLGMITARIPVGEDDSVAEQTWQMEDSVGRKDTLATMLGGNTLWEEGCLAECC